MAYQIYTAADYRTDLTAHINQAGAGDRVLLMTMAFDPTEPAIADVVQATTAAARRGAAVTVSVDAHSFLLHNHRFGPLLMYGKENRLASPVFRHKLELLSAINQYPKSRAVIINKPDKRLNLPIAGRSHIKIALVNHQIYIGGCNLQSSEAADLMVGWRDPQTADWLYKIMTHIIDQQDVGKALKDIDLTHQVDSSTSLYIDAGRKNQSIILEQALDLIDSAEKWLVLTCQFFPNSITALHLKMARLRGVDVKVVYGHPKQQGLVGGLGQQFSILRERTRVPKDLFSHGLARSDPKLHAKLIACDKGLMIGSHNYVRAGVALGTAEIALKSSNVVLAKQAVASLQASLKQYI